MYTITSADGELIAAKVSRQDLLRLRGLDDDGYPRTNRFGEPLPTLIHVWKRRDTFWWATVPREVILAELKRDIVTTIPGAQDSRTTRMIEWQAGERAGRYIEHHTQICQCYPTTNRAIAEHVHRSAASLLGPVGARVFLKRRHPEWQHETPLDLLAAGEGLTVLRRLQSIGRQLHKLRRKEPDPTSFGVRRSVAAAFPFNTTAVSAK